MQECMLQTYDCRSNKHYDQTGQEPDNYSPARVTLLISFPDN